MRLDSFLYLLFCAGAFSWPFTLPASESGTGIIRVLPSEHRTFHDVEPGTEISADYELVNMTTTWVEIVVAGRSCSCIAARLSADHVAPGQTSTLSVLSTAPRTGASSHSTLLRATPLGHSPGIPRQELLLRCTVGVARASPLMVVPNRLSFDTTKHDSRGVGLISLSLKAPSRPSSIAFDSKDLENIQITQLNEWQEYPSGVYSTLVTIEAPPAHSATGSDIEFAVRTMDGTVFKAGISIDVHAR